MTSHLLSGYKKGILGATIGVLVVAVSLTAQAPKAPLTNQPSNENGRYVFWSVPLGKDYYQYGFLDTKRGRVWFYASNDSLNSWTYYDLNEEAIKGFEARMNRLVWDLIEKKQTGSIDSTTLLRRLDSLIITHTRKVREKEK